MKLRKRSIKLFPTLNITLDIKLEKVEGKKKINFETLEEVENYYIFSVSGNYTRIPDKFGSGGGQCQDELKEIIEHFKDILKDDSIEKFNKILYYWNRYCLNDMKTGTLKQESFLKDNNLNNWANDYTNICNILKGNNLFDDRGYKFGHGWLLEVIPQNEVENIKELIESL